MGEAAVKEPSMEDILSSIRKIISEENTTSASTDDNAQVDTQIETNETAEVTRTQETSSDFAMSDVLDQVRGAQDTNAEINTSTSDVPEPTSVDEISNSVNAARMFSASEEVVTSDAALQETQIPAENEVVEAATAYAEPELKTELDISADVSKEPAIHVEMADAQPAQSSMSSLVEVDEISELNVQAETPKEIPAAAVEAIVKEEIAFKGALMSPSSNGEVAGAFDRLKRSAMDDIDAKTESILRPMLREWLDENLPNMVERLVREEIERVARGV